jgi:hypothetical protein
LRGLEGFVGFFQNPVGQTPSRLRRLMSVPDLLSNPIK